MLGESVQFIDLYRREGALLLPAAGIYDNEKIQCEYVTSCGFAEKRYDFSTFHRRKEQSPFPTVKTGGLYVLSLPLRSYRCTPAARQGCRALREKIGFVVLELAPALLQAGNGALKIWGILTPACAPMSLS